MTSYERTTVGLTPSATFTDKLKLSEGGAGLFNDEVSGKCIRLTHRKIVAGLTVRDIQVHIGTNPTIECVSFRVMVLTDSHVMYQFLA